MRKPVCARTLEKSRRRLLRTMAGLSLGLPVSGNSIFPMLAGSLADAQEPEPHASPAPPPQPTPLSPEDDKFLNDLELANFLFFWEQADPNTGLTKDRCNVRTNDTTLAASIASTGFGLTALCIGEKRGFVSRADARARVVNSLSFIWHKLPTHRGFFFHFDDDFVGTGGALGRSGLDFGFGDHFDAGRFAADEDRGAFHEAGAFDRDGGFAGRGPLGGRDGRDGRRRGNRRGHAGERRGEDVAVAEGQRDGGPDEAEQEDERDR